jgi:hypothetical protein
MSSRSASAARTLHSLLAVGLLTVAVGMGDQLPGQDRPTVLASTPHPVQTSIERIPLSTTGPATARGSRVAVPQSTRAEVAGSSALAPLVGTDQLSTHPFSLVAVTWSGTVADDDLVAYARTRSHGTWTRWFALAPESGEHAPDPGTAEAAHARQGTVPLLGATSDGVQVRVDARSGTTPRDLRVELVDPGSSDADGDAMAPAFAAPSKVVSLSTSPRPPIRSRAAWGADESKVKEAPGYGTVKGAFVHHTVNSNDYSMDDVPGLIRSIYAYHVDGHGWNDIGYNFIVDRFGRIWEGRKGGVDRAVIGAHTSGYNSQAFAMSTLGTFTSTPAPPAVITAYTQLFAWKFSIHGVDPRRTTYYNTNGNQAISGHRDVGQTACPGDALYAQIPSIRSKVLARMDPFPRFDTISAAGDATGDHNADVVAVDRDGTLLLYPGSRSTGNFLSPRKVGGGWQTMDRVIGPGDFDGDGKDDLIGREARTGYLWLYPGSAKDRTPYATRVRIGTGFGKMDNLQAAGDLTGDGFPDVVSNDNDRRLSLFAGNGSGGFLPRFQLGNGWYTINEIAGGGDYTGDGRDDLVGRSTTGDLFIYPGPGAPDTGLTTRLKVGSGYNYFDTFIGPGQWTPDSKPDLLLRGDTSNKLSLYYGNGSAGFKTGRIVGTGW